MATTDCASYWWREKRARWIYLNERPEWEDPLSYQWTPTQFMGTLGDASPGEAGDETTNETAYTGYTPGGVAYPRGAPFWTIAGPGTASVRALLAQPLVWPRKTDAAATNLLANSFALLDGVTPYAMCYSVRGAPLAVPQNRRPQLAGGAFSASSDSSGSGTVGGYFDSWELLEATYLFNGPQDVVAPYAFAMPGMVPTNSVVTAQIGLAKADPRAALIFPNSFAAAGGRNATFEPTAAEWDNYARVSKNKFNTQFDVVLAAGVVTITNLTDIIFPTPGGASSGVTLPWLTVCFRDYTAADDFLMFAVDMDSDIVVPNGGGAPPTIPAGDLVLTYSV